jgi:phage tail tube protein FII
MKTKNTIILIIVLLALAGVAGFLFYSEQSPTVTIEDKKILENTEPFDIEIVYPYIVELDNFNQLVENIINKQLADFKTVSIENDNAVKEIDPINYEKYPRSYYLSISYEKGQIDKNIASVVLNVENFTGGAHGAHYPISINYDVKNQKEIKLADLFLDQDNYLQKISDYCITDLTKQMEERLGQEYMDSQWIKEGAGPKEENYSVFLINPPSGSGQSDLTFYFPEYQVAAYAVGSFTVTMPR